MCHFDNGNMWYLSFAGTGLFPVLWLRCTFYIMMNKNRWYGAQLGDVNYERVVYYWLLKHSTSVKHLQWMSWYITFSVQTAILLFFCLWVGAHIQSFDPVEQLVIIKFGYVCKHVRTCKDQWLPLERLVDEDCFLPWQGNKCQTLYYHRDMVLSHDIPPYKPVSSVGIPL